MEFKRRNDGKNSYPSEFKLKMIAEIEAGKTIPELARQYQLPVQNIHKWWRTHQESKSATYSKTKIEETVPMSEYRQLEEEIKKLKKALANVSLDKEILKDAVEIAAKKKWIPSEVDLVVKKSPTIVAQKSPTCG